MPNEYQVDDFQVRTPTDIIGQHIHLVKFDVTSSDGGSNGFNYEDGTFSPEEVQERIDAVRALNSCPAGTLLAADPVTGALRCPEATVDPRFGTGPDRNCNGHPDYLGAQTTVQRWWADPVRDHLGNDRTLRTIFTHDHFGPSTHQQAGLYAGLVVEPAGSRWFHNEQGYQLGINTDGSPTSWQARILTSNPDDSYREFMLEYADFQLAYEPNGSAEICPDPTFGYADPANAVNPAGRKEVGPPLLWEKPVACPINKHDADGSWLASTSNGVPDPFAPCPEAVSADDPGMWVVNYRNEPLAMRISTDPNTGPRPPVQVRGAPGDPSFAYETRTDRANPEFNKVPDQTLTYVPYPALTRGLHPGDPFTPVMRVFEGDRVQIRTLVGAHEEEHNFSVHGLKWLFEPFDPNAGYRNSQMAGISEWFDFIVPPMPNIIQPNEEADFLVKPNSSAEGQWSGVWALLRLYQDARVARSAEQDLPALDEQQRRPGAHRDGEGQAFEQVADSEVAVQLSSAQNVTAGLSANNVRVACPPGTFPPRSYDITAVAAREVLPVVPGIGRTLVYNRRNVSVQDWVGGEDGGFSGFHNGPLHDPAAILFVETSDLDYTTGRPKLRPNAPVEPLILRAKAGECIRVTLRNDLPDPGPFAYDLPGWSGWLMLLEGFNANQVAPSREVGLHPQLVSYDLTRSDGANVGRNPFHHGKQTVAPGQRINYYWYAGDVVAPPPGPFQVRPIELGSTALLSSDTLEHSQKGAVGALIIEPAGSSWQLADTHPYLDPFTVEPPRRTRAEARVTKSNGTTFREFVTVFQDDLNLHYSDIGRDGNFEPVESLVVNEDPTESGQRAFGYRTEPVWYRMGWSPDTPTTFTRDQQLADVFTDAKVGDRPVTHIFDAEPGDAVRFRTVHPGGHTQNHVFEVQGHLWPELPYLSSSTVLGFRTASEYQGTRHGVGPDLPLRRAAGQRRRRQVPDRRGVPVPRLRCLGHERWPLGSLQRRRRGRRRDGGGLPPSRDASRRGGAGFRLRRTQRSPSSTLRWQVSVEGVAVEATLEALDATTEGSPFQEGRPVRVSFRVTDEATGERYGGLYPAAWMDRVPDRGHAGEGDCQDKAETFLGGSLLSEPEVNLNVYYVLALERRRHDHRGRPALRLRRHQAPRPDPAREPGRGLGAVAPTAAPSTSPCPTVDRVAVVDTGAWKVTATVDVGGRPGEVALQEDGRYLWVADVRGAGRLRRSGRHGGRHAGAGGGRAPGDRPRARSTWRSPVTAAGHWSASGADGR